MVSKNTLSLAITGLVLTNIFWAWNAVLARYFRADISAFDLNFYRWCVAFLILTPFCWTKIIEDFSQLWHNRYRFLGLGVLSVSFFNFALYQSAHTTSALNIGLFNSLAPLFTVLMGVFFLAERVSKQILLGVLVAFTGALVILAKGQVQSLLSLSFQSGDVLMLSACIAWGLYTILLRRWTIACHALSLLWATIAAGLIILLPFKFWLYPSFELFDRNTNQQVVLFVLYAAVFAAILAYLFWINGVKLLGASVGSMSLYANPCFIAIFSTFLLDDLFAGYHLMGALLILAGLSLVFLPKVLETLRQQTP